MTLTEAAEFVAQESARKDRALRDLREALDRYGRHLSTCDLHRGVGYYQPPEDAVCTCGFDQARGRA